MNYERTYCLETNSSENNSVQTGHEKTSGGGKDIEKLLSVAEILAKGRTLPPEYKDHTLRGKYKDKRACHVEPDWILIYAIEHNEVVLYRTGSHSELFR